MKKEDLNKIVKNAGEVKDKATKIAQGAAKTAGTVKQAIAVGVSGSKVVLEKAGKVFNKQGISQGLDATSKGVGVVAKGARIASKGVQTVADSIEKASAGMKKMSDKLKG